jgi:hypothetical protein
LVLEGLAAQATLLMYRLLDLIRFSKPETEAQLSMNSRCGGEMLGVAIEQSKIVQQPGCKMLCEAVRTDRMDLLSCRSLIRSSALCDIFPMQLEMLHNSKCQVLRTGV